MGLNLTAGMDVCLLCVLSGRGFCDELITCPRGVLPNVALRCVWSRNLVNEEAIARAGLQSQREINKFVTLSFKLVSDWVTQMNLSPTTPITYKTFNPLLINWVMTFRTNIVYYNQVEISGRTVWIVCCYIPLWSVWVNKLKTSSNTPAHQLSDWFYVVFIERIMMMVF
jgi:hypothetical protein